MFKKLFSRLDKTHVALAACITGQMLWGFSFMFTRIAQESAPPMVQLSIRFIISAILMTLPVIFRPSRLNLKGHRLLILLAGSLILPAYHFLEGSGIYYTNSSFAAIALSLLPILALALAAIFLKEFPTRRQVIFSFLPIIGVIMITLANSQMGAIQAIGVVLLLLCSLVGAFGRILSRYMARQYTAFERNYFNVLNSAIVFTAVAFFTVEDAPAAYVHALSQPSFIFSTLFLCVMCTVAGELLVNYSYGVLPIVKVSSISAMSTICSLVVGVVFLHEPVNAMSLFGCCIALIGIWQVNKVPNSEMKLDPAVQEAASDTPAKEEETV